MARAAAWIRVTASMAGRCDDTSLGIALRNFCFVDFLIVGISSLFCIFFHLKITVFMKFNEPVVGNQLCSVRLDQLARPVVRKAFVPSGHQQHSFFIFCISSKMPSWLSVWNLHGTGYMHLQSWSNRRQL